MDRTSWKTVKLGDIIVKMPKASHAAKDALDDGQYPFFTNSASDKEFFINDIDYNEPIILANTGGKAYFKHCDKPCGASRDLYVFKTISGVNTKWLYYQLKQLEEQINEFGFAGAALKHLQKDYLHNLEIKLPSEEEQLKIVNTLSTLDSLIEVGGGQYNMIQAQKSQLMTDIFNRQTPREEWKTVKIKDIFDIKRGYVLKASETSKEQTNDYIYPVYSSQTLNDGLMGYWNEYLYENAITWTTDGAYAGTVKYRQGKFYCTNVCGVLIPKVEYIDAKFVSYILGTIAPNHVVKVGNPKLMNNVMAEIEIPLPPLAEQKKIAKLLSEYDALIEANDNKSENLRKSKAQLMSNIFAERESLVWEAVKLGDICNIKSGGTPSTKIREYYEGNIPFLSINDMTSQGKHVKYTEKHINEDAVKSCSTWKAPANTIVYSMCASVGFVSIVDMEFTMNQAIAVLTQLRNDVDRDYLYYYLDNYKDKPEFERVVTTGAQRNINATILKNFDIELPPLSEQQRISKLLTDYDNLASTLNAEIEVLKNTKSQLMTDIFA